MSPSPPGSSKVQNMPGQIWLSTFIVRDSNDICSKSVLPTNRSNLYLQVVFTSLLLSLSASVFLGTALLHILPEVGFTAIPLSLLGLQISEPVFEINILGSS